MAPAKSLGDHDAPGFGASPAFDRRFHHVRRLAWWIGLALLGLGMTQAAGGAAVPDAVARAAIVYGGLLGLLRLTGKRTLGELTPFDLIILLLLSEAVQPALVGEDTSLTTAFVIVGTLLFVDVSLAFLKFHSEPLGRWLDDVPTVLVRNGVPDGQALARNRVGVDDVMEAARTLHGLAHFRDVRHAVMERSGSISIVPWARPNGGGGDASGETRAPSSDG